MQLDLVDWLVVAAYFAVNLIVGLVYRKKASESVDEYFAGGRNVSWWLAGTSMVATTFAADTPLAVTGLVASHGIAGNWLWWNMLLGGMLTVFFFARLWRRAGVLTDVELVELRYGGKPAAFLRGFRALYLGLPINCIILGWVNLAMVKILTVIFPGLAFPSLGIHDPKVAALLVVFAIMLLTASISTLSGLWGVLVTDLIQFVLKMGMVIVLAYYAVSAAGGMSGLKAGLQQIDAQRPGGGSITSFLPEIGSAWMPLLTFFVYIAVTWWATWYPGAEPGGGGYVAQRMFSAKDERHSLLATLWFTVAHYALRPWPWILAALASLVLYPKLADKESGYIQLIVDPNVFPSALRGLMVAAFAAAYMSTVGTQLNWGASYLINDVYKRFWRKEESNQHYIRAAQLATLFLMLASCLVTYYQTSVSGAWKLLIAVGAGTGSVQILRWFWWRLNAWSEVSAMGASLVVSLLLPVVLGLDPGGNPRHFAIQVLGTVAASTITWLAVTFLTRPEPDEVLLKFYRRVQPHAGMWGPIAAKATDIPRRSDLGASFIDWVAGCSMVYLALFGMGKLLFGEYGLGLLFLVLSAGAATLLYFHLNRRGWKVISDS